MRSSRHFDGNISYKRLYYLDLHNIWAGETNHADPRVNVGIFYIQALNDSNEHINHLFTILYMQLQNVIKADTHAITVTLQRNGRTEAPGNGHKSFFYLQIQALAQGWSKQVSIGRAGGFTQP